MKFKTIYRYYREAFRPARAFIIALPVWWYYLRGRPGHR